MAAAGIFRGGIQASLATNFASQYRRCCEAAYVDLRSSLQSHHASQGHACRHRPLASRQESVRHHTHPHYEEQFHAASR